MRGKPTVVAIGEILWDIFPDERKIGGAPANFVYYASKLGERAVLVSRVGQDSLGVEALKACQASGLTTDFLQRDERHPTGKVRVELDQDGQPRFEIEANVAWDFLEEDESLLRLAEKAKVLYFGTLAQRSKKSRATIQKLLTISPPDCLKVLDLNLRPPYFDREVIESSLILADILKLSSDELKTIASLFAWKGTESNILKKLLKEFSLRLLALTNGSEGSCILTAKKKSRHPGYQVMVVDTVGAGDAFTAALVHGLLANFDLNRINALANQLASFVCTRKGAWVNISSLAER